jgi:hypothetical protein
MKRQSRVRPHRLEISRSGRRDRPRTSQG